MFIDIHVLCGQDLAAIRFVTIGPTRVAKATENLN